MKTESGTIERLARTIGEALKGLETRFSGEAAGDLFEDLGIQFPPGFLAQGELPSALNGATAAATSLGAPLVNLANAMAGGGDVQIAAAGALVLQRIALVLQQIAGVGLQLGATATTFPGLSAVQRNQIQSLANDLPSKLLQLLLVDWIETRLPQLPEIAGLIGIRDFVPVHVDPANPPVAPHIPRTFHLNRLGPMLFDPVSYLKAVFGFGRHDFDGLDLLRRIKLYLDKPSLLVDLDETPGKAVLEASWFRLSVDESITPPILILEIPMPPSWHIYGGGPLVEPLSLEFDARGSFPYGTRIKIAPPLDVSIHPPVGSASLDFKAGIAAQRSAEPIVLFAVAGGTKLEAHKIAFNLGLAPNQAAGGQPSITGEVVGGNLTIDLSGSDGFISTITGGVKLSANLDFKLHWSPSTGFQIEGSSAIEIAVPTHLTLGPIDIQTLYLKFGLALDGSLPAELSSAFKMSLGPLQASVDRIGLTIKTTFPDHGGNLGLANLAFSFKPPSGVGLVVNAGIVQGGGFLYIDTDRGEYAGALELVFADFLSLHAIGLITTKMPDGSSGFSLLIIITADFGTGIQLGFGFTLLAVGGLVGLNRTMLLHPLMDGVRTGAINSIMFPQNVVANAPRIISDLRAIFPPQQGTFLIGPMAKLGWGEPTLISLALGVIIEIPGDIAILGVLKLALPADDIAVIVIQVNFAGVIEFSKKRLYFFASLFDSRVLFITIEGEMGVLFAFGDDANFVISVGGFHPQYNPPPLPFPSPRRIQVDIINESYARIRCDGYFAVTSDSVQFGSHSEFFFGFSALSVEGHSGFDALLQFSPFHFSVSISTSFAVKVFGLGVYGIDIDLSLSGPTPYHAHGTASLSFLFFSIGIGIDFTWGDSRDTMLPPIAVMPMLADELGKQGNWRAILPRGSNLLVSLRQLDQAETDFVLHPVGSLHISQRAIPLDLTLDKVGNQKPSDANRFALTVVSAGLAKTRNLQEQFAPAQFKNFDDAAKLSQPGYSPQDSGIELSAAGTSLASGTAITRIVRYDLTVIDTKYRQYQKRFFVLTSSLFSHFLGGASVARCELSAYRDAKVQPFAEKVTVGQETFAVALRSNNAVYHAEAASFTSQATAHDYLNRAVASDPNLAGTLHVLPQFEVTL